MNRKDKLTEVMNACPIYGITGGTRDVVPLVKDMLSAGIRIIQYREKGKTPILRYQEAMILRRLTSNYHALLIIDDYVDLALAVHADGVHIGQADLPPNTVRRIVGPNMLIGWSTHSISDLKVANRYTGVIDYIGVGPIFSTQTKPNANPVGISIYIGQSSLVRLPLLLLGALKPQMLIPFGKRIPILFVPFLK